MTGHREGILSSYFAVAVTMFLCQLGGVTIELLRRRDPLLRELWITGAVTVGAVVAGALTVATPIDLEPTLHRVFAGTFFVFAVALQVLWALAHRAVAETRTATVLFVTEIAFAVGAAVLGILFMTSVLDDIAEFMFFLCVQINTLLLVHALVGDDMPPERLFSHL
jgi:peptidoglycan/LPS O-acetylase OafA/YrhL